MPIQHIVLVDINASVVAAWRKEFQPFPEVQVTMGSIFDVEANTLISPANSFGNMDGGLDGKLFDFFGPGIEAAVRARLTEEFHGELPVGLATLVETKHERFPYLICAPTMRYPTDVSRTINAYLAMKALLNVAHHHPDPLQIAVPGLCALSGRMPPVDVARQMRIAYERVMKGLYPYSHWREEWEFERFIRGQTLTPPVVLNWRAR